MNISELWLKSQNGKERDKVEEFADRDGMSIRISAKGKVVYQLRYRFDGKPYRMDLGTYPMMSLKAARTESMRLRAILDTGLNPKIERQIELKQSNDADSLESLFRKWYEAFCKPNKKGHFEILRSFEIYVFPQIGHLPMRRLTLQNWMELLDEVATKYKAIAARILFNTQQLYKWAVKREYVTYNILNGVSAQNDLNFKKNKTTRVLSDEEIIWIFEAMENSKMAMKNKIFIKLCLLFGCRNGELRIAKKTDFDFKKMVWTVPIENHKTGKNSGKPLVRPITEHAAGLIRQAMDISNGDYLITNAGQSTPISKSAPLALPLNIMQWIRKNKKINMEHWSMHDLRRTARTNFSALTTYEVAETMLGHTLSHVHAVYDHYEYLDEQRVAYEKWHEKLANLIRVDD